MKKLLALVLALAMALSLVAVASADEVTELPRNETLYHGGWQYGAVAAWNPLHPNSNNSLAISANPRGSRTLVWETLYMYNSLDGQLYGLLANDDMEWNEDMTVLTFTVKAAAKWNDGTPVTADDVVATWKNWELCKDSNATYNGYIPYIKDITAEGDKVTITAQVNDEGKPVNPLLIKDYLTGTYIFQKAWLEAMAEKHGNDGKAICEDICADKDVPYTGPYTFFFDNDQLVALVRDDNYWGQDESMWGKLPVAKYQAHTIYSGNDASYIAFKEGQIDVNQQFASNIQDLWEKDGLPISTYMDEAPYGVCATMPTAWFNMEIPVLQVKEVRKAIAMAVDYDTIIANAMTNQSPSFADVPRSVMNPTEGEQALIDHEAIQPYQWDATDDLDTRIEKAKALLDEAGIVDTDGDGYREYNGEKISLKSCCPNGWTDWQAAMEVVAAAGEKIGLDITTNYPEWDIYQTVFTAASQTEFDIFMWSPAGAAPSSPWARVRNLMSSEYIGINSNWSGNFGHWKNDEADALIAAIPLAATAEEQKELYTKATILYLDECPSFSLMYRPESFYAVNESVWTNFVSQDLNEELVAEGKAPIPPLDLLDGYSIAGQYLIELVGE
jgi:peptide/nickel transport system substrate-binding protein